MKIITSIYLTILFLLVCSCSSKENVYKEYYQTGELLSERFFSDNDSIYKMIAYYKNGNKQYEGYYEKKEEKSLATSEWKSYFSDGTIMWEGRYEYGRPVIPALWTDLNPQTSKLFARLDTEHSPIVKGKECNIRVVLPQIHPSFYAVTDTNYIVLSENQDKESAYPFVIIPQKTGIYSVFVIFRNDDGIITSQNPKIVFDLEVIE